MKNPTTTEPRVDERTPVRNRWTSLPPAASDEALAGAMLRSAAMVRPFGAKELAEVGARLRSKERCRPRPLAWQLAMPRWERLDRRRPSHHRRSQWSLFQSPRPCHHHLVLRQRVPIAPWRSGKSCSQQCRCSRWILPLPHLLDHRPWPWSRGCLRAPSPN